MSFFSTPLSGLTATSAALQAISNNLANMNTTGYKAQNASFSDVFYQNLGNSGSGNPIQSGLGVQVDGTSSDLSNGAISTTAGVSSNLALNGSGYFVTQDASGAQNYTRAGDFGTNTAGQLVTPDGQLVMGFPAANGVVNTNAPLQAINVGTGTSGPASASSNFSLTANLDSATAVGGSQSSQVKLYDSLGATHLLSVTYTKTGDNTWSYSATVPSADIQGGTGTATSVGSGTLTFDSNGALTSPTGSIGSLSMGPLSDGAATFNPTWNLTGASGTGLLTQTASAASTSATTQDGYAAGTLASFAVLADGTVQATFTNEQTRAIGQVAVASFANPEGLSLNGGNLYNVTSASGAAVIGTAGTGGRGVIKGSALEGSNVDVATEFADMIVAQRSYEANAKAITAFDQIEQATIAMKT